MKPLLAIWIKPRQTFEFLTERSDEKNDNIIKTLFLLISLGAGFSAIPKINEFFGGDYLLVMIFTVIGFGLLGLVLWYYVFSFVFWGISKLFQGKATQNEVKLAIALSFVPNLIHLLISVIMIIPAIILSDIGLINYQNTITTVVLWIFSIRILIIGLAYFNKYSYGYAILTIILPGIVIYGIRHLL